MKKTVLTLIAVLSMTFAYASNESTKADAEMQAYDMTVDYNRLGSALGMTLDQIKAMKDIHKTFCVEMMNAAAADKEDKDAMVNSALDKDLKYMRYILTGKQYDKYELLLKTTLRNRGLIK